jgi:hypothetical protein
LDKNRRYKLTTWNDIAIEKGLESLNWQRTEKAWQSYIKTQEELDRAITEAITRFQMMGRQN